VNHAWFYAHAEELIDYRPHNVDEQRVLQALELVRAGIRVYAAARQHGIPDTVLRNRAAKQGLVSPVSWPQRRIDNTNRRVDYLRLRLAGLPKKSAASAIEICIRTATSFESGVENF